MALSIVRLHQSIGLHCSCGTIYQSRIAHLDYIIKLALLTVKSHSLSGLHDFRGATSYLSKSHYGYGLHQPNGLIVVKLHPHGGLHVWLGTIYRYCMTALGYTPPLALLIELALRLWVTWH